MAEIGHVLIGDPKYDSKCQEDRSWCPRVFLHSYRTCFREPFTMTWYEATSPLSPDLGEIMEKNLTLVRVKKPWTTPKFLSRRHLVLYKDFLAQYDQKKRPLLMADHTRLTEEQKNAAVEGKSDVQPVQLNGWNEDPPGATPQASWGQSSWEQPSNENQPVANGMSSASMTSPKKKRKIMVPPQFAGLAPKTPPMPAKQAPPQPAPQAQYAPAPVAAAPPPGAASTAGWRRIESRSSKGVFYYFHEQTGATRLDPFAPWEKKESRSSPGVFYFWNTVTGATQVELPVI
jgi:hypothetical protein